MTRSFRLLFAGLLVVAGGARRADAQTLRLDVRDSVTALPVSGVLVSALDSAGQRRADGLSSEGGTVTLRLPSAGTYTLSLRRIGVRPQLIRGVLVTEGPLQVLAVHVTSVRQTLDRVRVYANSICGRAPEGEDRTGALWEQVSLALRAATITQRERIALPPMRVIERSNDLTPGLQEKSSIVTRDVQGFGRLVQAADPDTLAARGYVRREPGGDVSYFAPDETVLLSDAFLATHCFSVPKQDANSLVAELRFTPIKGRRVPDVEGTAYVDIASGELRQISFTYVAPRSLMPVRAEYAGGDVFLRRLPNGAWIVNKWSIRMPLIGRVPTTGRLEVAGYREVAGVVQELRPPVRP